MSWALLVLGAVLGGLVLTRPRLLALPDSFPGSTALGFLLLAIGMTSPLVLQPEEMMLDAGAGQDAFIGTWNLWETKESILNAANPYSTDLLFAPEGTDLSLHTHSVTYGGLSLPFQLAFAPEGPPGLFGVYNLIVLLSFALTGYLTYRLALSLTGHRGGALLAGTIFAFSAFRYANTVRLHVLATEWFVLFIWAWIVLWKRPSPLRLIGATVAGLLLLNASLEYTAYAAVVVLGWSLAESLARIRRPKRAVRTSDVLELRGKPEGRGTDRPRSAAFSPTRWALGGIVSLGLFIVGAMPLLVRLLPRLGDRPEFDPRLAAFFSADLVDYILPNPRHPLWGDASARITAGFHLGDDGFGVSVGWLPLVLFAWAGWQVWRARAGRRWWVGAVAALLVALGPELQVAGRTLSWVPMPLEVLSKALPFLDQSRTPIRWIAPAGLCLSLAVAWAWAIREKRLQRTQLARTGGGPGRKPSPARGAKPLSRSGSRVDTPILWIGAAALFLATPGPLEFTRQPVPGVYRHVAKVQRSAGLGRATLIHLPGMLSRENLLFQTVHHQRLVEDVENAIPLHSASKVMTSSPEWNLLVRELAKPGTLTRLSPDRQKQAAAQIRAFLETEEIRWIVVPSDRELHAWALRAVVPQQTLGHVVYDAYRANLRVLEPIDEVEMDGMTLFQF